MRYKIKKVLTVKAINEKIDGNWVCLVGEEIEMFVVYAENTSKNFDEGVQIFTGESFEKNWVRLGKKNTKKEALQLIEDNFKLQEKELSVEIIEKIK